jgi:hypothetical protein
MRQVAYPMPLNNAWKEKVVEAAANVLLIPSTRARPAAAAVPSCSTDNVSITSYEPEIDLSVEPNSTILEELPRLETEAFRNFVILAKKPGGILSVSASGF